MAQQKYLKRFKALKSRIIMTDELMTMYQSRVKECSLTRQKLQAAEGKLNYLDDCIRVHKKELDILHQEKERFREDCDRSGEKNRRLEESLATEKDINRHLLTQLQTLQKEEEENKALATQNKELAVERDKWKEMYQKLKRESALRENRSRSRRRSSHCGGNYEASLLPTPLTSPPSSMGSMDNMDLHFFSASSPFSPHSSSCSLRPSSHDRDAEGDGAMVMREECGDAAVVGGELVKCVGEGEGGCGDTRSRVLKEEELFGCDSDSDSDGGKSDRLLSPSPSVSSSLSDFSSSSDEEGIDDLRKLRDLLCASGKETLMTAMDALDEKMCTLPSGDTLLPSSVSGPASCDGCRAVDSPVLEGTVVASSVLEGTVVASPVLEGTVVASSVLEGTVVATPVLESTIVASPVLEGTVVVSPVLEGTVVAFPVMERTVVASSVLEGTVVASSVLEGTFVATPVLESTIVASPVLEGTVVVSPVLEGTVVAFPVMERTVVASSVLESTIVASPVLEGTVVVSPVLEGTVVAFPVMERTVVASSVLEGTVVASSVLEGTFVATPVLESTIVASPVLEGTVVVSPVLEGTVVAFPVMERTVVASSVLEGTVVSSSFVPGSAVAGVSSCPSDLSSPSQDSLSLHRQCLNESNGTNNSQHHDYLPQNNVRLSQAHTQSTQGHTQAPQGHHHLSRECVNPPGDDSLVELAAADTSSGDDSDDEVSSIFFSPSRFAGLSVLSPLPPSPTSFTRVLSPFPTSPSPVLSPLPHSPRSLAASLSPLPLSPINNHATSLSPLPPSPNNLQIVSLSSDQQGPPLSCPSLSPCAPSPKKLQVTSLPSDKQGLPLSSSPPQCPSATNLQLVSLTCNQQGLPLSHSSLSPRPPSLSNLQDISLTLDQHSPPLSCSSLSPCPPSPSNLQIASSPSNQQGLPLSCPTLSHPPVSPQCSRPTLLSLQSPKRTSNQQETSLPAESEANKCSEQFPAADVAAHLKTVSPDMPFPALEDSSPSLPFSVFDEQGPSLSIQSDSSLGSIQSDSSLGSHPSKRARPRWTGDVTNRTKKRKKRVERDGSPVASGGSLRDGEGGSCEGVGCGRGDCEVVETVSVMDFGVAALPTSSLQDLLGEDCSREAGRSVGRVSPTNARSRSSRGAQKEANKMGHEAHVGVRSSPMRKQCPSPLLASFQPPIPPSSSSPELSMAQHNLVEALQCPLPLPMWLVSAMTEVQSKTEHCAAYGHQFAKKKGGNRKEPIFRPKAQNPFNYVVSNLERLVCGHLHLSTVITMFTKDASLSSSSVFTSALVKFFLECYNPKIEHVLSLFHSQCKNLRKKPGAIDPEDPNFVPALLRPECQIVALLAHMCRLSKCMCNVLPEASWALYQAALRPRVKFHKLIAIGRVFTALIRLQADPERLMLFLADLLKKPLLPSELYIVVSVATIWPTPARKKKGVVLKTKEGVNLKVLEGHMLQSTLEVVVLHKYHSEGKESGVHEAFPKNLLSYYRWDGAISANLLASSLMQVLETSSNVYIDSSATSHSPWQRPRPSIVAYQLVYCLNLLALCKGWPWTNDFLIGRHLWPILQEWNGGKGCGGGEGKAAVKDAVVVCVLRLMGFLSIFGVKEDPTSSSIGQLQRVLLALLKESSASSLVSLPMQLATVDSLLEMSPPNHSSHAQVLGAVRDWLKLQETFPWGHVLKTEFKHLLV